MRSWKWVPAALALSCTAAYAQDTDQRAQRILDRIDKEIRDSHARLRDEIRALIRAEIEKSQGKAPTPPPVPAPARPYLGISVDDLTQADRTSQGVSAGLKIIDVRGPAEKAGLKAGDILVEIEGKPATEDLLGDAIGKRKPGDTLEVAVVREKKKQSVKVVLGERKE